MNKYFAYRLPIFCLAAFLMMGCNSAGMGKGGFGVEDTGSRATLGTSHSCRPQSAYLGGYRSCRSVG